MRNILLAIMIAVLPASVALAEPANNQKPPKQSAAPDRLLPTKGARAGNSCAAYGPGFVKADGTDTCVKLGGGIGIETGRSVR
jgi:hypothetical protein